MTISTINSNHGCGTFGAEASICQNQYSTIKERAEDLAEAGQQYKSIANIYGFAQSVFSSFGLLSFGAFCMGPQILINKCAGLSPNATLSEIISLDQKIVEECAAKAYAAMDLNQHDVGVFILSVAVLWAGTACLKAYLNSKAEELQNQAKQCEAAAALYPLEARC
jgi:hypothetical protein